MSAEHGSKTEGIEFVNMEHVLSDSHGVTGEKDDHFDHEGEVPHLHARTYLVVVAVTTIYFAQLVNLVGSGAFRSSIAAVVGGGQNTTWIIAVTVIFNCYLPLPVSQAADYFGRRWFLIICTFLGVIGSIIIARAQSMGTAIAGETILSLSYGCQPLLHTVASEVLTRRSRGIAQAAVNGGVALGGIAGLLVGGAMTLNNPAGFRNFWYFTAGWYAVAVILTFFSYNPPPRPSQTNFTLKEKLRRLDWVGYVLLGPALVMWVLGLEWADNPYPWKSGRVLGPVLGGAVLLMIFVVYEWRFKKDGILHHAVFTRHRNFPLALFCVFVEGLIFFTANAFLSYQVAVLYEKNSILTSLHYSIAFIVYIGTSWCAALYTYKFKRVRLPSVLAFIFFVAFEACMASTQLGSRYAVWGYPVLLGCGLGLSLTAIVTAAQLATPPDLIATASGLLISFRAFGGTLGLAIYTAIFHSKLDHGLVQSLTKATLPLGLSKASLTVLIQDFETGHTAGLTAIPGMTTAILQAAQHAYLQSFVNAVRGVWITAACFGVVAAIASCFFINPVDEFNLRIDGPAEKEEAIWGKRSTAETGHWLAGGDRL